MRSSARLYLAFSAPLGLPSRLAGHGLVAVVALVVAAAAASQPEARVGPDLAMGGAPGAAGLVRFGPLRLQELDADFLVLAKTPILTSAALAPAAVAPGEDFAQTERLALRRREVAVREVAVAVPPPADRREPLSYVVQPGDNVHAVAARFGLSAGSIVASNGLDDANLLSIGQELLIPPVDGVLHTVRPGDTVGAIAALYGVESSAIVGWAGNELRNVNAISVGQRLLIPGGQPPELVRPAPSARGGVRSSIDEGGARLAWPTRGLITTYFGEYGHRGLDIAPPYGTPVRASAAGRVITAEKLQWSWGWYIVLDHGSGLQTLYGHLSRFDVKVGDRVDQGQQIGAVGDTGRSTGPHLHLEVTVGGALVNPLRYLP